VGETDDRAEDIVRGATVTVSPTGLPNLLGRNGTGVAIRQGIQVIGVLIAIIAGVITTRRNYQDPATTSP
jgi:hypothetical protein